MTRSPTIPAPENREASTLPTRLERPRAAPPPENADLRVLEADSRIGEYRIVRRLGAGGMGAVYAATHVTRGKEVALKILSAELSTDTHGRARFLREAEAASKIDHPNVQKVIDFSADGPMPYIVMPLLRGQDLDHRIDGCLNGLPVAEVADIFLGICAGVTAAHLVGIVHRDLKPHNVFLAISGQEVVPKVLDFGISKVADSFVALSLTAPGSLMGTTGYVSPEHLAGEEATVLSDQYSLGVVLYESLTGHLPFEGEGRESVRRSIMEGRFSAPSRLRADLPRRLEQVVLQAMARDPAERFPTVHHLGAAVLPFASSVKQLAWTEYYTNAPPAAPWGGHADVRGPAPRSKSFLRKAAPVPIPTSRSSPAQDRLKIADSPPTMLLGPAGQPPFETLTREAPGMIPAVPRGRPSRWPSLCWWPG